MLSLLEVAPCIPIVLFTWKIQGKAGQGISLRAGQKLPMESTALKAHSRREHQAGDTIGLLLYCYCKTNTLPASSTCTQAIPIDRSIH